jgi:hypothetical protein
MNKQEVGITLMSVAGFILFVVLPLGAFFGYFDWRVYAYTIAQPPNYYVNFVWAFIIFFFTLIRWSDARKLFALSSVIMGSTIALVAVYIAVYSQEISRELVF